MLPVDIPGCVHPVRFPKKIKKFSMIPQTRQTYVHPRAFFPELRQVSGMIPGVGRSCALLEKSIKDATGGGEGLAFLAKGEGVGRKSLPRHLACWEFLGTSSDQNTFLTC